MNHENEEILNEEGEETGAFAPRNFGENLSFLSPDAMPDLEEAELGFNIQPQSVEFAVPGEKLRGIYTGTTILQVKDQNNPGMYVDRETAVLQTKDGIRINMGANLVKQLKLLPPGTPVQITYKGEEKTQGGRKVKAYEIVTLRVPGLKIAPVSHQIDAGQVHARVATAVAPAPPKTEYKNAHLSSEYWRQAYTNFRLTEQEGKDHLAEFGNDFAKALEGFGLHVNE